MSELAGASGGGSDVEECGEFELTRGGSGSGGDSTSGMYELVATAGAGHSEPGDEAGEFVASVVGEWRVLASGVLAVRFPVALTVTALCRGARRRFLCRQGYTGSQVCRMPCPHASARTAHALLHAVLACMCAHSLECALIPSVWTTDQ